MKTYCEFVRTADGIVARVYARQGGLIAEQTFADETAARAWVAAEQLKHEGA